MTYTTIQYCEESCCTCSHRRGVITARNVTLGEAWKARRDFSYPLWEIHCGGPDGPVIAHSGWES